jgi:hypothetical protein
MACITLPEKTPVFAGFWAQEFFTAQYLSFSENAPAH